ncbi:MAG: bifunctional pyr operon transcriptional regulator/uracil phosphoribosyltransferase PyrR [bacterium]
MADRTLLDERAVDRALRRLALQILEAAPDPAGLALVGVRTRGVPLARRLAATIATQEGLSVPVGELDIALYRDDVLTAHPEVRPTVLPFEVEGRHIVLVDDVLFTGRTVRAALDALMAWGRPRVVRLAVLVDRGHRELPLHADFVGLAVDTTLAESVAVRLAETDGADQVLLCGGA